MTTAIVTREIQAIPLRCNKRIINYFGKSPSKKGNPDEIVAMGLAVLGELYVEPEPDYRAMALEGINYTRLLTETSVLPVMSSTTWQ